MLTHRPTQIQRSIRSHRPTVAAAATLAALLCGFAARCHLLGEKDVWWDEGLAVWAARLPLRAMAEWTAGDVHPPLYFALLHFWRLAVGDSEFAVRYLSVLFGVTTVAATAALARRVAGGSWGAATAAACLLATSRFAVWWSQEARMYALAGLLVVMSLHATLRLASRPTWRRALLLAALNALLLWTLYLGAAAVVVETLYLLAVLARRGEAARPRLAVMSATSLVASAAALAPWLAYMLPRTRSWSVREPFDVGAFAQLYATLLVAGESTNVDRALAWWLPALAGAAVLLVVAWRALPAGRPRADLLLLPAAVVLPAVAVAAATALPRDFGYSPRPEARYLLPFAAPFSAMLGVSVVLATRRLAAARTRVVIAGGLTAVLCLPGLAWLPAYYGDRVRTDDYVAVAATLSAYVGERDAIVLHSDHNWPVFAYHWPGPFFGTPHLQPADAGLVEATLGPVWARSAALWLVVNDDGLRVDKDRLYERWLAERATRRREWRFGAARLLWFARGTDSPGPVLRSTPTASAGAGSGAIMGSEVPLARFVAGTTANLFAYVDCSRAGQRTAEVRVTLGQPAVAVGAAPAGKIGRAHV